MEDLEQSSMITLSKKRKHDDDDHQQQNPQSILKKNHYVENNTPSTKRLDFAEQDTNFENQSAVDNPSFVAGANRNNNEQQSRGSVSTKSNRRQKQERDDLLQFFRRTCKKEHTNNVYQELLDAHEQALANFVTKTNIPESTVYCYNIRTVEMDGVFAHITTTYPSVKYMDNCYIKLTKNSPLSTCCLRIDAYVDVRTVLV